MLQSTGQRTVIEDSGRSAVGYWLLLLFGDNPAGNATKAFSLSVQGMNELKNMCIEGIVQYILNVIMLCTILQFLVGILFIHFNEGLHN